MAALKGRHYREFSATSGGNRGERRRTVSENRRELGALKGRHYREFSTKAGRRRRRFFDVLGSFFVQGGTPGTARDSPDTPGAPEAWFLVVSGCPRVAFRTSLGCPAAPWRSPWRPQGRKKSRKEGSAGVLRSQDAFRNENGPGPDPHNVVRTQQILRFWQGATIAKLHAKGDQKVSQK